MFNKSLDTQYFICLVQTYYYQLLKPLLGAIESIQLKLQMLIYKLIRTNLNVVDK